MDYQQWEYEVISLSTSHYTSAILNEYGSEGWELLSQVPEQSVQSRTTQFIITFKRPLRSTTPFR